MRVIKHNEREFNQYWNRCFHKSEYQLPLYQRENIAYYENLSLARQDNIAHDCSFVLIDEHDVLAATKMMSVKKPEGVSELSIYAMLPIWFFENTFLSAKRKRKVRSEIKSQIMQIIEKNDISRVWYKDPLHGRNISSLSKILLSMGANATPEISQVIDLDKDEATLFQNVRKSYKSLINWGRRNLDLKVYDSMNISSDLMEQFRLLHIQAAGKETRSKKTWMIQKKMIQHGEAFAVFGELDDNLVSAALFPKSRSYCFYGVSASNRNMFDKPLSHAVVWTAVLHAMKEGCRYFELGPIQYPGLGESPSSGKELSISTFKQGFGGRSETRLSVVLQQRSTQALAAFERDSA